MLRDIQPPVLIPLDYRIITIFTLLAAISVCLLILYLMNRKGKKEPEKQPQAPRRSPYEIALERLESLAQKEYVSQGKIKQYYTELGEILRFFIEESLGVKALEMTTEEFLISIKGSAILKNEHKDLLKSFLNQCDLVKFAKYSPPAGETETAFDLVKTFVVEVNRLIIPVKEVVGGV